jgi:hypothetical protein
VGNFRQISQRHHAITVRIKITANLGYGGGFLARAERSTSLARTIPRCQRRSSLRKEANVDWDRAAAGAGGPAKDSGAGDRIDEIGAGISRQDLLPRLLWIDACHARIINPKRNASYPDLAG